MKTRKAEDNDLDVLSELFDQYRIFYRKESDLPGAKQFIQERMKLHDSVIFVLEDEEKPAIVGFTQLYPLYSSTRMKRLWLLNDLYIMPLYRGKGFSKMLMEVSKTWAEDTQACGILLETEVSNTIGNALYPAVGFEKETHSNFYFWTNNKI